MNAARIVVFASLLANCSPKVIHAAAAYDAHRVLEYSGKGAFFGACSGFFTGTIIGGNAVILWSYYTQRDPSTLEMAALLGGALAGGVAGAVGGGLAGGVIGWRYGLCKVHGSAQATPFPLLDWYHSRHRRAR